MGVGTFPRSGRRWRCQTVRDRTLHQNVQEGMRACVTKASSGEWGQREVVLCVCVCVCVCLFVCALRPMCLRRLRTHPPHTHRTRTHPAARERRGRTSLLHPQLGTVGRSQRRVHICLHQCLIVTLSLLPTCGRNASPPHHHDRNLRLVYPLHARSGGYSN